MLGAVCVGVVPPGVTAFGAGPGAGVVCENAGGALTQVRAKANIAIFLMRGKHAEGVTISATPSVAVETAYLISHRHQ